MCMCEHVWVCECVCVSMCECVSVYVSMCGCVSVEHVWLLHVFVSSFCISGVSMQLLYSLVYVFVHHLLTCICVWLMVCESSSFKPFLPLSGAWGTVWLQGTTGTKGYCGRSHHSSIFPEWLIPPSLLPTLPPSFLPLPSPSRVTKAPREMLVAQELRGIRAEGEHLVLRGESGP